ncbi:fibronectin type III domain-containing protein [Kineococcus sp. SYSU DK005]|uniref:fibronectin type III domain-containing protein n=1 Tax=Kineococcus sp. SYSU DK005 TaxID=3383126 RepID=UPI003D7CD8F7
MPLRPATGRDRRTAGARRPPATAPAALAVLLVLLALVPVRALPAQAATGLPEYLLDVVLDGTVAGAEVDVPDVAADSRGNVYVADQGHHRVLRIAPDGTRSVVAGTGRAGAPTEGPATASALNQPIGVDVDDQDNLYVADMGNRRVERIDAVTGELTVVAGDGSQGAPRPGRATDSPLQQPVDVAVDPHGNVHVVDQYALKVLKVTPAVGGRPGELSVFAGDGTSTGPRTGDGPVPATSTGLFNPVGIAIDSRGVAYVTAKAAHRVYAIDPAGALTIAAGVGTVGEVRDGARAVEAHLSYPERLAVDLNDNVYIADEGNDRIDVIDRDGTISVVAGTGEKAAPTQGPARASALHRPTGLATDPDGNVYVADQGNRRVEVLTPTARPVVSGPDALTVQVGEEGSVEFTAEPSAPPAPRPTWSVVGTAPAGLAVDAGTGRLTWAPRRAGSTDVRVQACTWGSRQCGHSTLRLTARATTPGVPREAAAGAGERSATVSWRPPATDGGSAVTGYAVTTLLDGAPAGAPVAVAAGDTSALVRDLLPGRSYSFTVAARNAAGTGAPAATAPVVPTARPVVDDPGAIAGTVGSTTSRVLTAGPAQAALTWSVTGTAPAGLSLEGSGALTWAPRATGTGSVEVRACGAGGLCGSRTLTLTATAVPGAPTAVDAGPGERSARVSWEPPADDGGTPVTGYVLTTLVDGSADGATTAVPAGTRTVLVTGLRAGVAHRFTVAARNAAGTGEPSPATGAVVPTAPPAAPVPTPTAAPTGTPVPTPTVTTPVPTPSTTAVPTPSTTAVPTPSTTAVPTPSTTAVPTPSTTAVPTPSTTAVPTPTPTPTPTTVPVPAPTPTTAVPTPTVSTPATGPAPVPVRGPVRAPTGTPASAPAPRPSPAPATGARPGTPGATRATAAPSVTRRPAARPTSSAAHVPAAPATAAPGRTTGPTTGPTSTASGAAVPTAGSPGPGTGATAGGTTTGGPGLRGAVAAAARTIATVGVAVVRHAQYPAGLLLLALLFLLVQHRIDRDDPKLALAPLRPDPETPFPPARPDTRPDTRAARRAGGDR